MSSNSISAYVSELSHRGAITPGITRFGRDVACYREWLRGTYIAATVVAVFLYRDFYHQGATVWHRGGAHVEVGKLF